MVRVALWGSGGSIGGGRPPLVFYLPTKKEMLNHFETAHAADYCPSRAALHCNLWETPVGKSKEHEVRDVNFLIFINSYSVTPQLLTLQLQ